jgi:hypothetical protein
MATDVPRDWLQQQVSAADVEKEIQGSARLMAQWDVMKAGMEPGDEIWHFTSPADSWKHLAGRAGYVILRAGRPVGAMLTMMN